jgi:hypothetical protein
MNVHCWAIRVNMVARVGIRQEVICKCYFCFLLFLFILYSCECRPGWMGQFCDVNINECASQPCQNEATCLDDVGRFICICMPGYNGMLLLHQQL